MRSETSRRLFAWLGAATVGLASLTGCLDYTVQPQTRYGAFLDERDGRSYRSIAIGSQTWMAENLGYAGTGLCYDADPANCALLGRLYTWSEATGLPARCDTASDTAGCIVPPDPRGICPSGWHLPTDAEWSALFSHVGGDANRLKALSMGGDGASGFEVLSAGLHDTDGVFKYLGVYADFWSATPKDPGNAWEWYFEAKDPTMKRLAVARRRALSVRCLQD